MTLTGRLLVDTVMLRSQIAFPTLKLDVGATLMMVNDARRSIFNEIYPIMPNKFMKRCDVPSANFKTFVASDRFVRVVAAWNAATTPYGPAKLISFQELDSTNKNSYQMPTTTNPGYTVEKLTVRMYPNTITNWSLWYVEGPSDLTLASTESFIPWEFTEAVILNTLLSVYTKLASLDGIEMISTQLKTHNELYKKTFFQAEKNSRVMLQSAQPIQ